MARPRHFATWANQRLIHYLARVYPLLIKVLDMDHADVGIRVSTGLAETGQYGMAETGQYGPG